MVLTTLRESQHRAGESLVRVPTVSLYVLPRGRHFRGSHRIMSGTSWRRQLRQLGRVHLRGHLSGCHLNGPRVTPAEAGARSGLPVEELIVLSDSLSGSGLPPPGRGVGSSVPCSLGVLLEKNPLQKIL